MEMFDETTYIVCFYDADGDVLLTSVATYENTEEGKEKGQGFVWDALTTYPKESCSWSVRAESRMEGAVERRQMSLPINDWVA